MSDNQEINVDPALCLFDKKVPEQAIHDIRHVPYHPITQIGPDSTVYEFLIDGEGGLYTDMSRITLKVKARLVNEDDGKPANAKEFVVNNLLSSVFSQVECYLNQKLVTDANYHYPLKSYLELLIGTSADEKANSLQSQLFFLDKAGKMDSTDILQNTALLSRHNHLKDGNTIEMAGRLHIDCFKTDKFLLNGVNIRLKFFKQKTSFYIMTSLAKSKAKLDITHMELVVPKIRVNPNVIISHAELLKKQPVIYSFNRHSMISFTVPIQHRTISIESLFSDQIPARVLVAMIKNKAFAGDVTANPYNFHHFGLNSCGLVLNGQEVPGNHLQVDFSDPGNTNAGSYRALTDLISKNYGLQDTGGISQEMFNNGYCILSFDIAQCSRYGLCETKTGNLRLWLEFSAALTEPVTLLIYGTFPAKLSINHAKNVTYQM